MRFLKVIIALRLLACCIAIDDYFSTYNVDTFSRREAEICHAGWSPPDTLGRNKLLRHFAQHSRVYSTAVLLAIQVRFFI